MLLGISIIIPSYNGLELLKKCLPPVLEETKAYGGEAEILIVDDGGNDGTSEQIPKLFPQIKIVKNANNLGFAKSINVAVKETIYSLIFLLNNDIEITRPLLKPLAELFIDKSVFCAQPNIVSGQDNKNMHYLTQFKQIPGFFIYRYCKAELNSDAPVEMDFVSGGCSMFDKNKFLSVGLFDERFSPVYFEDIDICFRARQFNWKVLYCPAVTAYHLHPASTVDRKYSPFRKDFIHKKNYFAFLLKHLFFFRCPFLYPFTLVLYSLVKMLSGQPAFFLGFTSALKDCIIERRS